MTDEKQNSGFPSSPGDMLPLVHRMVIMLDWKKILRKKCMILVLNVATGVTILSGLLDLLLWIQTGYTIPSWTMCVMASVSGVLMQAIRRLI